MAVHSPVRQARARIVYSGRVRLRRREVSHMRRHAMKRFEPARALTKVVFEALNPCPARAARGVAVVSNQISLPTRR